MDNNNTDNEKAISKNPLIKLDEGTEFFEHYSNYNSSLRTWFVTFSIGTLYLLLTQKVILTDLRGANLNYWIEIPLFIAISIQVTIVFVNKYINWLIYYSTVKENFYIKRIYKLADKISEMIWIDFICDSITIFCYLLVFLIMIIHFG